MGFFFGIIGLIIAAAVPKIEAEDLLVFPAAIASGKRDSWMWERVNIELGSQVLQIRYSNDELLVIPVHEIVSVGVITDSNSLPLGLNRDPGLKTKQMFIADPIFLDTD